jgi:hypothetical protein
VKYWGSLLIHSSRLLKGMVPGFTGYTNLVYYLRCAAGCLGRVEEIIKKQFQVNASFVNNSISMKW